MNYVTTYTTGKAREVIENYQGLPNGCCLALKVLKQRFGQNAMIVEALKSSVMSGPKIRNGDSAGGKEPTLKELSAFITGESQTLNDPVYGRSSTLTARVGSGNRYKKQPFMLKPASMTPITTMKTEVVVADASINQGTREVSPVEDNQVIGSSRS